MALGRATHAPIVLCVQPVALKSSTALPPLIATKLAARIRRERHVLSDLWRPTVRTLFLSGSEDDEPQISPSTNLSLRILDSLTATSPTRMEPRVSVAGSGQCSLAMRKALTPNGKGSMTGTVVFADYFGSHALLPAESFSKAATSSLRCIVSEAFAEVGGDINKNAHLLVTYPFSIKVDTKGAHLQFESVREAAYAACAASSNDGDELGGLVESLIGFAKAFSSAEAAGTEEAISGNLGGLALRKAKMEAGRMHKAKEGLVLDVMLVPKKKFPSGGHKEREGVTRLYVSDLPPQVVNNDDEDHPSSMTANERFCRSIVDGQMAVLAQVPMGTGLSTSIDFEARLWLHWHAPDAKEDPPLMAGHDTAATQEYLSVLNRGHHKPQEELATVVTTIRKTQMQVAKAYASMRREMEREEALLVGKVHEAKLAATVEARHALKQYLEKNTDKKEAVTNAKSDEFIASILEAAGLRLREGGDRAKGGASHPMVGAVDSGGSVGFYLFMLLAVVTASALLYGVSKNFKRPNLKRKAHQS
eukprot:GILI01014756.1.p1 GENE.GILI01014756.1~~GILI01014756.1.p1  ORF type:complete len:610 (-),score=105.36 GILI01014756.1:186-1784(-)